MHFLSQGCDLLRPSLLALPPSPVAFLHVFVPATPIAVELLVNSGAPVVTDGNISRTTSSNSQ